MERAEWYVDWFNSPYYHLLYNNRNFEEANHFMEELCRHLQLQPHARIWDLACGKGRHAISLNKMGFDVTGTDLASNSIKEASEKANANLEFLVHDMRTPFRENYFDAVFNLFTSIGYFKDPQDNYAVFKNVAHALKPGSVFVIDFFNAEKICSMPLNAYTEKRPGLDFRIKKNISNNAIIKRIEFEDQGHSYYFEESVSLLRKTDFESFASEAGLRLRETFGDYHLRAFNEASSDRLILIFEK